MANGRQAQQANAQKGRAGLDKSVVYNRNLASVLAGLICLAPLSAQVYDWTMIHSQTQGAQMPLTVNYGPRNYISAGTFNASNFSGFSGFSNCNETHTAYWGPGSSFMNGNGVAPATPFPPHTEWPYEFRWHCSFDETFFMWHPSTFYAGVLSSSFYEVQSDSTSRYNYVLFELKDTLAEGVDYRFQGRIAAAEIQPTAQKPYLEGIGMAVLDSLPVPDGPFAFLQDIVPFVTTPPGELVTASSVDLDITITGHGQRFLVVGLFSPIDSLLTSSPPVQNTDFHYVLEDFFLYRPDCDYATTMFFEPDDAACRDEVMEVGLQYGDDTSPFHEWYVNGVLQQDSVGEEIMVSYGGMPETIVMAVTDTGICQTSNNFTINWRGVGMDLPDTFQVCGDPVLYEVEPVLYHISPSQLNATWNEVTGPFSSYNQPQVDVTFPDSGLYALALGFAGCQQLDTVWVGPGTPLVDTTSMGDPTWYVEIGPEHCENMNDGFVAIHDTDYPGELHYQWSVGTSSGTDTSATSGLATGPVILRMTDDAYRCSELTMEVPLLMDSCSVIQGKVFEDDLVDCMPDSAENGFPLRTVQALPIGNVAITGTDGSYSLLVPPGSYTVVASYPDPLVGNVCGNGTPVSLAQAGDVMTDLNIADTTHIPVSDVAVQYLYCTTVVIGEDAHVIVAVRNKGELTAEPMLRLLLSPNALTFYQDVVGGQFIGFNGDTMLVQLDALAPGQEQEVWLDFTLPADPALMEEVAFLRAALDPLPEETSLEDNVRVLEQLIYASFDPNDKTVSPVGSSPDYSVDTTVHRLQYMIRFQNTGNYPATTVRLEDPMPSMLDMGSLHVLGSSHHPMHIYAYDSILYFEFPSIMLPDSTSDPAGSQGWVTFEVDVMPGMQYGDSIGNVAYIYFDQNPPIITPPAVTHFGPPSTTSVIEAPVPSTRAGFILVPNPAVRRVAVVPSDPAEPIRSLEVLDLQGRSVSVPILQGHIIDLDGLNSGSYLVLVHASDQTERLKLMVR